MTADPQHVFDQEIPRRRDWLVLVRNVLRFYGTFLALMVMLLAVVGVLSDASGLVTVVGLLPLAVLMLPGAIVATLIAYLLPLRRSKAARLIAVIDFAACAYLGTAFATSILAAATGVYGFWAVPIFVATISGLVTGLVVEPRPTR